jgi:hypothetical protein
MLSPVAERYCTRCGETLIHQRRRAPGAANLALAVATLGAWGVFWSARAYVCEKCGTRASRGARRGMLPARMTADELRRRLYICRTCRKVNSTRETECLRCAAPKPPPPLPH